jgi:predicted MPP superfamily phosphohydrolase
MPDSSSRQGSGEQLMARRKDGKSFEAELRQPTGGGRLLNRRQLIAASSLAAVGLVGAGTAVNAVAIEPLLLPRITRYRISPEGWPPQLRLSLAVIADLHACDPWMTVGQIEQIVHATNLLGADAVVLLGDYVAGHKKITAIVPDADWAGALGALRAPAGVFAVLGNHDWWEDERAQLSGRGPIGARVALERAGIPVLENDCVKLDKGGSSYWIAGLGDQQAFLHGRSLRPSAGPGVDDLDLTLSRISDDSPVVLLAHEPDIFPKVPERVAVTLSGHTHGGQVRLLGRPIVAPSHLSLVYNYGHYSDEGRHLIVSGGLGCSWWPVRIGVPPEIVHIVIEGAGDASEAGAA